MVTRANRVAGGGMSIPDEAVRAGFIELYERAHVEGVSMSDVRRVLEAVAPSIAAQALREASDAYPLETAYGGAEHAILWLKERADRITK